MGKDHKIIFNLTIKDLKELGIIKRRRKNKNKYYVNKYGKKIKVPYSNSSSKFGEEVKTPNLSKGETFVNTSTINDDTSRLRNELAQQEMNDRKNKSSLVDDISSYMNPQLLQIKNDIENAKIRNDMENETNRFAMKFLYDNMQSNRFEKPIQPASTFYNPVYEPYIEPTNYAKLDDGIDVSTTGGSDEFINSNIAPNNNKYELGPPPTTPTLKSIYTEALNHQNDLDSLLAPTPAPKKKEVHIDPEYLEALSDKTPFKINSDMTPNTTNNPDTDIRFQPKLDNLFPLGEINQKMGGGVKLGGDFQLEQPEEEQPSEDEEENQDEKQSDFDKMIKEMQTLTTRQRQYLKERKKEYEKKALERGEKPKKSIMNASRVEEVTKEIKRLDQNIERLIIENKRLRKKTK